MAPSARRFCCCEFFLPPWRSRSSPELPGILRYSPERARGRGGQGGGLNVLGGLESFRGDVHLFFLPPRAAGWPETDSPRKMIASSGVETKVGASGIAFVAIFRCWKTVGAPPLSNPPLTLPEVLPGIPRYSAELAANKAFVLFCLPWCAAKKKDDRSLP